ncbi:Ig-like domain-containing protein [Nisaea acidiphila]|uniref:Ig-like domain-containing protein n=1 Tax=Nisaea acidiphila TaxID=1862145 RepID=A0A9J7AX00_9PROT|nr:LysM peptidoglycan-binding domain-containing protein [Nisaea acidiphila]UUX50961.1 Ig-like domain-containing protein [Nisaea acidiphila]
MLTKPYLIGAAGALVLAVAGGLLYVTSEEDVLPVPAETATVPAETPAPAPSKTVEAPAPAAASTAPEPKAASEGGSDKPDLSQPSFDVVRVDPEGNTVIAGKALPNATVRIMDGDRQIGEVQADDKGDWVFLPEEKLPSGSSVLTLETPSESGEAPKKSGNAVVVVIPEKGKDIAGQQSQAPQKPLAMVVPREEAPSAPTKVLQVPKVASAAPPSEAPKAQSFPETPAVDASTAESGVSLDVIDYDDKGEVVFSGKTEPDTEVQVYVDNKLVARATSDAAGNWSAKPETRIEAGTHQVRVDKISNGGKVLARIELPFVRAVPFTGLPEDSVVIIQPGNNLWRIASRVYGSGFRYTEIYQANSDQIRDPDLIYPGQVFGLPAVN